MFIVLKHTLLIFLGTVRGLGNTRGQEHMVTQMFMVVRHQVYGLITLLMLIIYLHTMSIEMFTGQAALLLMAVIRGGMEHVGLEVFGVLLAEVMLMQHIGLVQVATMWVGVEFT